MERRENFLLLRNENFRNFTSTFLLFSSALQNLLWLPLQLQFSVAKETEGKRRLGVDGVKARLSIVVFFFSRLDCSWFRFCVDFLRYHALFSVLKYYQFEMLISIIGYEGWSFCLLGEMKAASLPSSFIEFGPLSFVFLKSSWRKNISQLWGICVHWVAPSFRAAERRFISLPGVGIESAS